MHGPIQPSGSLFSCGFVWDDYHHCPDTRVALKDWVLAFYWTHCKDPFVGFEIFRDVKEFNVPRACKVCIWQAVNFKAVALRLGSEEYREPERYLQQLEPGNYSTRELVSGVCFATASKEEYKDYAHCLEVDGFPSSDSPRVTGLDKALTGVGLERGRLPHMYKVGKDTAAVMLLLLHGASRMSLAGFGEFVLPHYVNEEDKPNLLALLLGAAVKVSGRRSLSTAELDELAQLVILPILGGVVVRDGFKKHVTPSPDAGFGWEDVDFRLVFGWDAEAKLCMEVYDVGGVSASLLPHAPIVGCECGVTLFLNNHMLVGDSRPTVDFVNVNGADVVQDTVGTGFGNKFGDVTLRELSRKSGIAMDKLDEARGQLKYYRLQGGLLQKSVYCKELGTHEFLTVIPEGSWRSVEYAGEVRRLSLRRYVILVFHCTAMSIHKDRDRTVQSIVDAGLWWSKMHVDVGTAVRHCQLCKCAKGKHLVTGHQRTREYDGPFRYLIIDFVGPMSPLSARGMKFMFTCACAWSGWYWCVPCKTDTGEEAAEKLFYFVMCDLAGFPVCIGSDRALAFIEGVVSALKSMFNILEAIGSAYHPQAQSPVERPHREYNAICKTFMADNKDWDLMAPLFQWQIRTSAKLFSGTYTPYETITGLKPRTPTDAMFSLDATAKKISKEQYVTDLVAYLKRVHTYVHEQHKVIADKREKAKLREFGSGTFLQAGDYCLVRRPLEKGISQRFQNPNFSEVYQVVECHGHGEEAKAYTVADLKGNTDGLGFSQPVASERLTPIEMLPLAQSTSAPTRLIIDEGGVSRHAEVVSQCFDGRVNIRFDDTHREQCVDLSHCRYRWL